MKKSKYYENGFSENANEMQSKWYEIEKGTSFIRGAFEIMTCLVGGLL